MKDYTTLLARLQEPIFPPPPPPKRTQKTWQGLEVGRWLKPLDGETLVEVVECSNHGMMLRPMGGEPVLWKEKDWKAHWVKVRRARTTKEERP